MSILPLFLACTQVISPSTIFPCLFHSSRRHSKPSFSTMLYPVERCLVLFNIHTVGLGCVSLVVFTTSCFNLLVMYLLILPLHHSKLYSRRFTFLKSWFFFQMHHNLWNALCLVGFVHLQMCAFYYCSTTNKNCPHFLYSCSHTNTISTTIALFCFTHDFKNIFRDLTFLHEFRLY